VLVERGLLHARGGKMPVVKILGDGELKKKLVISGCAVSGSARLKIEKAGGTIA
jgi:large subunit ribosomal protein L15